MNIDKSKILNNICYTELVYERINKKLKTTFSRSEIEKRIYKILSETNESDFEKIGKNYYATNSNNKIRITINSNNFRIITVDKI
jgi:FKBP-type peptidyl-prolyl cis-trans isomerase (trigger factor)